MMNRESLFRDFRVFRGLLKLRQHMTLKEELEILRGESIQVFDGDPMEIPCIETSDVEKLCKHPVGSVHMITYNHEPYIRQAIEGVMMQQADFEFELIIGEDCSQDKTREICFEYQKKYPDKIRVLWWHENVSKLGGNSRRVRARSRGEFIALCEGDDYWIDPLKLQKQVNVMRQHPNVGLCFTGSKILQHETGEWTKWDSEGIFDTGCFDGKEFFLWTCFGKTKGVIDAAFFIMTATLLFRRDIFEYCREKYEIFKWKMSLGDATVILALSSMKDVYCLSHQTSVYRRTNTGVSATNGKRIMLDTCLVRIYFLTRVLDYRFKMSSAYPFFELFLNSILKRYNYQSLKPAFDVKRATPILKEKFKTHDNLRYKILIFIIQKVGISSKTFNWISRILYYSQYPIKRVSMRLKQFLFSFKKA